MAFKLAQQCTPIITLRQLCQNTEAVLNSGLRGLALPSVYPLHQRPDLARMVNRQILRFKQFELKLLIQVLERTLLDFKIV